MPRLAPDAMPATRQGTVLATLKDRGRDRPQDRPADRRPVRCAWRVEEAGWAARNLRNEWHIQAAGVRALERRENRTIRPERWKVVRDAERPVRERRVKLRVSGATVSIGRFMRLLERRAAEGCSAGRSDGAAAQQPRPRPPHLPDRRHARNSRGWRR